MKKILLSVVTLFFATAMCAQTITNNIRQRLDPILASVTVADDEKLELIKAIETFQTKIRTVYKENASDKREKAAAITTDYEKRLQKILGKERYAKWKKDEKAAKEAAKAKAKAKGIVPSGVQKRLHPILAAVPVTETEIQALIEAIKTFQSDTNAARKIGDKEKAKQVNSIYQAELKRILGQERYDTYKRAEKEARGKTSSK